MLAALARSRTSAAIALAALCSFGLCKPAFAADAIATGEHFKIVVHFDDDRVAAAALETAEAAWPFAVAIYGAPKIEADKLLEVHLYRGVADYEAAEQALTHGKFKANLAFTSAATGAAHIALQPLLSDAVLAHVGLTTMTRELIAHEATHVVAYRAWPNAESLPDWFAEGSATFVCQEVMVTKRYVTSADDDPMLAKSAVLARQLASEKNLPATALIFEDKIANLSFLQRYAVNAHLFRFLSTPKHAKKLALIVDVARRTGGGPDHGAILATGAREALGGTAGLATLDREFNAYVRALTPKWDEEYRSLAVGPEAWFVSTFASNALCWSANEVGSDAYAVSGEFEILAGDKQQLNVLLGRTPNGFVQVSFTAGFGVNVFEFDNRRAGDGAWKRVSSNAVPTLTAQRSIPFEVRVAKSQVTVKLEGKIVCTADIGDHPMRGALGVGALSGSAGLWRKFAWKKS